MRGVRIRSFDGTELSADVHIPTPVSAFELFPVVIFANSWAMPKFEYLVESMHLAREGYLVVEYLTRGWAPSTGMVEAAGPQDQMDQSAVISYVLDQRDWRPDAANLALAGISYGGGLALLGAAMDSRVKTAISMSGWANLERALYENHSPNLVWGAILDLSGHLGGHMDPLLDKVFGALLEGNEAPLHEFVIPRSVETYADRLRARRVPLLLSNNLEDRLFQPQDMLDFFQGYTGPKKMLLHQGVHGSAEVRGPSGFVWDQLQRWLDHWLKDGLQPLDDVLVSIQRRDDKAIRETFKSWPSFRIAPLRYMMGPRGPSGSHGSLTPRRSEGADDGAVLAEAESPRWRSLMSWWSSDLPANSSMPAEESISFSRNSGLKAGMPVIGEFLQVWADKRIVSNLPHTARRHSIWYYSAVPNEMRLCGTPELSLDLTSSSSKWQVVAYLFMVDAIGHGTLISHGSYTCWECVAGQRMTRPIELRALCEEVRGGLAIGFSLFSDLYLPANTDPGLEVTLHYSDEFSLKVPVLLSGSASEQTLAVLV